MLIGFVLLLIVGRRRFYRRNVAGVEEYKSYTSALSNKFLNLILWFLGIVLIFGGCFKRCKDNYDNGNKIDAIIQHRTDSLNKVQKDSINLSNKKARKSKKR